MEGKGWSLVVKKIIIGCERIGLKNITLIVEPRVVQCDCLALYNVQNIPPLFNNYSSLVNN